MDSSEIIHTQATIIGSGLTGMAAALFGAESSMQTAVVGSTGASELSSGLIDLFGVLPGDEPLICHQPWDAIASLPERLPRHPYTRLSRQEIEKALNLFLSVLQDQGLAYVGANARNTMAVGPLGTLKPTYRLPATMMAGIRERTRGSPGLIVDVHGLKDFSARLVASNLEPAWPGLRTARLTFPGTESRAEVFTALLAHSLEAPRVREQMAQSLTPLIRDARALGIPAILGMGSVQDVHRELEDRLQVSIFEIPTLPASVPGLRMMEALKRAADASPLIQTIDQSRVTEIHQDPQGRFLATVQGAMGQRVIRSRAVILATGRFLGQGLTADRSGVRESLLDLPVCQPASRTEWHRDDFFDPRGHQLNLAGIEVDDCFQPLGSNSKPVYANLYAAGSILAHQDWVRMKCGAGLAIASAFQAVQCCRARLAKEHHADLG